MRNRIKHGAFIFYLFMFVLLKPILHLGYSTQILVSCCVGLFLLVLISSKGKVELHAILSIFIIFIILLVEYFFYKNEYTLDILYYSLIYVMMPIYLSSQITNYSWILRLYVWFSIAAIFLYLFDGINGFAISGDYMQFGVTLIPALYGLIVSRSYSKNRWIMFLTIICALEIVLFGNKGAILSMISFVFLYFLLIERKHIRILFVLLLMLPIFLNLDYLLVNLIDYLNQKGIQSYSFSTIRSFLEGGSNGLSGRDQIWKNAIDLFFKNPLFGGGVGIFESTYGGGYPHNIFLNILVEFGLFGFILSLFIIVISIIKVTRSTNRYYKIMMLVFFSTAFPKLFFSNSYWYEPTFWIFIYLSLTSFKNNKRELSL